MAHRCTKLELAQAWLGATHAQALIDLIADIEAFENAAEVISFWNAQSDGAHRLAVNASPKIQVILEPTGPNVPRDNDGQPNWIQVRRLKIIEVKEL